MEWKEEYLIHIEEIDKQHENLFKLVNSIKQKMIDKVDNDEILKDVFMKIVQYTKEHFETEESVMKKLRYPEIEFQRKQHKHLIDDIRNILLNMKSGKRYNVIQLYNYLNQWLLDHIITEDQKIRDFLIKRKEIQQKK